MRGFTPSRFTTLLSIFVLLSTQFTALPASAGTPFSCSDDAVLSPTDKTEITAFSKKCGLTHLEEMKRDSYVLNFQQIKNGLTETGMIVKVAKFILAHREWTGEVKVATWRHFARRFQDLGVSWAMSERAGSNGETIFFGDSLYALLFTADGTLYYGKIFHSFYVEMTANRRGPIQVGNYASRGFSPVR